jgi:allantoicase
VTDTGAAAFTGLIDLAAASLGGQVLGSSDDFFAAADNLIQPGRGVFIEGKFTDRGKWMDGWESRRKRVAGYDWCVLELGAPGTVVGFDVDTHYFVGNSPAFASIEGLRAPRGTPLADLPASEWRELLPQMPLRPDAQNLFAAQTGDHAGGPVTHVRLNIFPDGGVSRLRLWGTRAAEPHALLNAMSVDDARAALMRCCGASRWAGWMLAQRPFASTDALLKAAAGVWGEMQQADLVEAFAHHPEIGGDLEALQARFPATAGWSSAEQSGMTDAGRETLEALRDGNAAYKARFGHVFLVCATGKTAADMLTLLHARLPNDPETELRIAAAEQAKITRIRLERLA